MKSFDGKTALVTGGSSGIGLALARQLAARGAHVWIMARDAGRLEAACREIAAARRSPEQQVNALSADVTNLAEVQTALQPVLDRLGAPDLLVNSAGITHPGLFDEMDLGHFRSNMEVNYFGALYVTRLVVPGMKARRSGCILNISSLVALHGVYGYSAYGPSKAALKSLTDSLRYELKPFGIQVAISFPSDTLTPQLEYDKQHQPPLLKVLSDSNNKPVSADLVAENTLKALAKGKYLIFPTPDAVQLSLINNLLPGHGMYRFVDFLMHQARRKMGKNLDGQ